MTRAGCVAANFEESMPNRLVLTHQQNTFHPLNPSKSPAKKKQIQQKKRNKKPTATVVPVTPEPHRRPPHSGCAMTRSSLRIEPGRTGFSDSESANLIITRSLTAGPSTGAHWPNANFSEYALCTHVLDV